MTMRRTAFLMTFLCGWMLQAGAQSYLLNESFENTQFPPQGWSVADHDGDGHSWLRGTTNLDRHSGEAVAVSYTLDPESWPFTYYGAQDNWLITPQLYIGNSAHRLTLYYCAEDLETRESIEVRVSTTGTAVADFTDVLFSGMADNGYEDDIQFSALERSLSAYVGQKIYIAIRHQGVKSYALGIDDVQVVNLRGPQRVSGLKATAGADGQLQATLSWTNPTADGNGDALGDYEIVVYRDGELIATLPAGTASYIDDSPAAGRHVYAVSARNAEGESLPRQTAVYVGEDVPSAVGHLQATIDHGRVHLSWTAPTAGTHGGWLNPATLAYDVSRVVDGVATVVAANLSVTSYDEQLADGLTAYYTVEAHNATGRSEAAKSNSVVSFTNTFTEITVGADATNYVGNPRLPINMWGERSGISQTIYYPEEMQIASGKIHHIIYKNSFGTSSNFTARPLKVYMGETDQSDLAAGWVAADALQLVFDGVVALPYGDNDIDIELASPYSYNGGNLVITVVAPDHNTGAYFDRFYVLDNTAHANRSRMTDTDALTALAGTSGSVSAAVPYTRFALESEDMANLSGTVTDAATSQPIAGVRVEADGLNLYAVTDADGRYLIDNVKSGLQTFRLSATGYETKTEQVSVPTQGSMEHHFQLTALPQMVLSGTVRSAETNLPLKDAVVSVSGYSTAQTTTQADGTFELRLFAHQDYTLVVSRFNYDVSRMALRTSDADQPLPDVALQRSLTPPFAVDAKPVADGSSAIVSWQQPTAREGRTQLTRWGESLLHDYMLTEYYSDQDYYVAHAWTAQDTQDSAMVGQSFLGMRVYMQASKGQFTATVWRGTRADHEPIMEQPIPLDSISSEGGWVDIVFSEPVEIRQGEDYMVGVHAVGAQDQDVFGVNGSWDSPIDGKNNVKWSYVAYTYNSLFALNIAAHVGIPATEAGVGDDDAAVACEYHVYRLGKDDGEWTRLTASPTAATSYSDAAWAQLPSDNYLYKVTAVYQRGESLPAYSDTLRRSADVDAGVVAFVSPVKQVAQVSEATVTVRLQNFGEKPLTEIPVECTVANLTSGLDDARRLSATYTGLLNKGETAELELGTLSLGQGLFELSAATLLTGDDEAANNAVSLTLSNQPNVTLQGMRWDAYGNAGPITIESNVPEEASFKRELTPGDALIIAGEYADKKFYGFTATWWSESRLFVVLDPQSWTLVSSAATDAFVQDMAYDAAHGQMYALVVNDEGESTLATVQLATGELAPIGATGLNLHALASSSEGKLYAISQEGLLYTLSATDATPTLVGATGMGEARYLQSMAFDHRSGRLFWARTNDVVDGELIELNPASAEGMSLGRIVWQGNPSEVVALYVDGDAQTESVMLPAVSSEASASVYSLGGQRLLKPSRGVVIVRQADGSVRKALRR